MASASLTKPRWRRRLVLAIQVLIGLGLLAFGAPLRLLLEHGLVVESALGPRHEHPALEALVDRRLRRQRDREHRVLLSDHALEHRLLRERRLELLGKVSGSHG